MVGQAMIRVGRTAPDSRKLAVPRAGKMVKVNSMNIKRAVQLSLAAVLVAATYIGAAQTTHNQGIRHSATKLSNLVIQRTAVVQVNAAFQSATPDSRSWTWSPKKKELRAAVEDGVKEFLGDNRGSYIYPDALLSDQVLAGFTGPPLPHILLPTGSQFFGGQVFQDGEEGSAVILGPSGRVRYVALISYKCAGPSARPNCASLPPVLTIFTRSTITDSALAAFRYALQSMTPQKYHAGATVRVAVLPPSVEVRSRQAKAEIDHGHQ